MKKLLALLICSIIFTPSLMGMKRKAIVPAPEYFSVPEYFTVDCKKKILLDLAKNVHLYAGTRGYGHNPINQAKRIIGTISRINSDYYKELDKERNDAVTTRTMIKNIADTCYPDDWAELYLIQSFNSAGAKKCIRLSEQLYDKKLTTKKVALLFSKGALLNYSNTEHKKTILSYWIESSDKSSIAIIEKLLQLGANENMYDEYYRASPLAYAIWGKNIKKIEILLSYKAKKCWSTVLVRGNRGLLDILIANSTHDELNSGLLTCIEYYPILDIMEKFIDKGANPSVVLPHLLKKIINEIDCLTPNHQLIQAFNLLCDRQAHDSTTLNKVQNLQTIFNSLATKLENNSPK